MLDPMWASSTLRVQQMWESRSLWPPELTKFWNDILPSHLTLLNLRVESSQEDYYMDVKFYEKAISLHESSSAYAS